MTRRTISAVEAAQLMKELPAEEREALIAAGASDGTVADGRHRFGRPAHVTKPGGGAWLGPHGDEGGRVA